MQSIQEDDGLMLLKLGVLHQRMLLTVFGFFGPIFLGVKVKIRPGNWGHCQTQRIKVSEALGLQ